MEFFRFSDWTIVRRRLSKSYTCHTSTVRAVGGLSLDARLFSVALFFPVLPKGQRANIEGRVLKIRLLWCIMLLPAAGLSRNKKPLAGVSENYVTWQKSP